MVYFFFFFGIALSLAGDFGNFVKQSVLRLARE